MIFCFICFVIEYMPLLQLPHSFPLSLLPCAFLTFFLSLTCLRFVHLIYSSNYRLSLKKCSKNYAYGVNSICNLSLTTNKSQYVFIFIILLSLAFLPFPPITLAITYMEIKWNLYLSFPVGGKIATFLSQLILNYLEYQLLGCLFSAIVKSIEILCWLKKLSV